MIAYAARTGTRRNLAVLRAAGWRLMVSARGVLRTEGFPYALDNGAWTAFQQGEPFDVPAFEKAVARLGPGADFIVVPDIVMGGLESLAFSRRWLRRLRRRKALRNQTFLIAVQNGMEPRHVERLVSPKVALDQQPVWEQFGVDDDCYVLDDDRHTAVISQRGMGQALGFAASGSALKNLLTTKALSQAGGSEILKKMENPIKFQWGTGGADSPPPSVVHGFDSDLLIDVCNAVIAAERFGLRRPRVAKQALIIYLRRTPDSSAAFPASRRR